MDEEAAVDKEWAWLVADREREREREVWQEESQE